VTRLTHLGRTSSAALQVVFDEPVAGFSVSSALLSVGASARCSEADVRCVGIDLTLGDPAILGDADEAAVFVDVVDALGNEARAHIHVPIDASPPAFADVDAMVLVRQPDGRIDDGPLDDVDIGPDAGVFLAVFPELRVAGAEAATLVVLDGASTDAVELGRYRLAVREEEEATVALPLSGRDRSGISVMLVDDAGNTAGPTRVRHGRFFGSTAADPLSPAGTLRVTTFRGLPRIDVDDGVAAPLPPAVDDGVHVEIAQRRFATQIGSPRLVPAVPPGGSGGRTRGAFDPARDESAFFGVLDPETLEPGRVGYDGLVLSTRDGFGAFDDVAFNSEGLIWGVRPDGRLIVGDGDLSGSPIDVHGGLSTSVVHALAIDTRDRVLVVGDVLPSTEKPQVEATGIQGGGGTEQFAAAVFAAVGGVDPAPEEPTPIDEPESLKAIVSPWVLWAKDGTALAHGESVLGGPPALTLAAVAGDGTGFVVYGGRDARGGIAGATTWTLENLDTRPRWLTTPPSSSPTAPPPLAGHALTATPTGIVLSGCSDDFDDDTCGMWLWDWPGHTWTALAGDRVLRPWAVAPTPDGSLLVRTPDAIWEVTIDSKTMTTASRPLPTLAPRANPGVASLGGALCAIAGAEGPDVECRVGGAWRLMRIDGEPPSVGSTPHAVSLSGDVVLVVSRNASDAFVLQGDPNTGLLTSTRVQRPVSVPVLGVGLSAIPSGAIQVGGLVASERSSTVAVFSSERASWSTATLPALPEAVTGAAVGYDPVHDLIVVVPGATGCSRQRAVHVLPLSVAPVEWMTVTVPDGEKAPTCRNNGLFVWDDIGGRLVLAGGTGSATGARDMLTLVVDFAADGTLAIAWESLGLTPTPRFVTGAGVDDALGGLVLHGVSNSGGEDVALFDAVQGLRGGALVRVTLPEDLLDEDVIVQDGARVRAVFASTSDAATVGLRRRLGVVEQPLTSDTPFLIDPRVDDVFRIATAPATPDDPDPRVLIDALQVEFAYVDDGP
jgi:hypothetical protein